ncbi:MAG: glycosyltransferase family 2 protein [Gaiellaceae bacterium]
MTTPFFSIAIPTKNRPEALHDALASVVGQSFGDLEIVVCDNSDPADAERTVDLTAGFEDSRIRYVRTSGDLSMPDNWEHAVGAARGEYVGVLTDRSVLRPDALQTVQTEIEKTGALCVSWFGDLYGRNESRPELKRRGSTFRRYRLESAQVLDHFLNGEAKTAAKVVPKLMTAVCHRSVLDAIRGSAVGRCCPPICPDFTSGFLILSHTDWILTIDEPLYVSCGTGTGFAFRSRGELGDRFRSDLGMTWAEMVDRMPSEACFSHGLVLNDLMRLRDTVPEWFPGVELNRAQYYIGCLNDYRKTAARGISERDDDLDVLLEALERESSEVRAEVERSRGYRRATGLASLTQVERAAKAAEKVGRSAEDEPSFSSVFEAMAWDAANPREPRERGLLDLVGGDESADPDLWIATAPEVTPGADGPSQVGTPPQAEGGLRTRLRRALGRSSA